MRTLIFIGIMACTYVYAQNALPYFEEWIGNANQYDDGAAYCIDNRIFVKSVSLVDTQKKKGIFYERKGFQQYTPVAEILTDNVDEYDNKYLIVPLIEHTYLRIEKKNEVKNIILPDKAVYHTVCRTENNVFVIGDIDRNAYFVCLDKNGDFKYEYAFHYPYRNQIKNIVEDKQGNLYLAGYVEQAINSTFDAWVVKLSPQKEILWSKLYGTNQGTDEFYRIQCTGNGLLCSGITYRNGNFDTYILHTDTEGNFANLGNMPAYSYLNKKLLNVPVHK